MRHDGPVAWFTRKKSRTPREQKLDFLRRYAMGEGDLDVLEGPVDGAADVPRWWRNLHAQPPAQRVQAALAPWRATVARQLSNTIAYLGAFASDVELLRLGQRYYLLYTINNRQGGTEYYAGGNPRVPVFAAEGSIQPRWHEVPVVLRAFYEQVHDGFFHFPSRALGLEALEDVSCLNLLEAHYPLQLDVDSTYNFFSNMMGSYVVIDLSDSAEDKAALWWQADPPAYGINFWDVVDEWIVIGFEPQ